MQKSIGTKRAASAKGNSKSNGSWTSNATRTPLARFAICLKNKDCDDLVVRKLYQILPDPQAEKSKYIRLIDESGEDYLYPASYFFVIELPLKVERTLEKVAIMG